MRRFLSLAIALLIVAADSKDSNQSAARAEVALPAPTGPVSRQNSTNL
jgi:hypothetical protein